MIALTWRHWGVRSSSLIATWLGIVCVSANVVWLMATTQPPTPTPATPLSHAGSSVASRTPYTVRVGGSTRRSSGYTSATEDSMTMALRSDGAFVTQFEHISAPTVLQRTIEFPNGVTDVVDDIRERHMSTLIRPGSSLRARMDPAQNCIVNDRGEPVFPGRIIGRESIVGHDTVMVQSGNATWWLAPDLGCAQLETSRPSAEGAIIEQIANLVIPGEPDGALFYVPGRYNEVPPSVFFELDKNAPETLKRDGAYYSRRPPK
jgi:hypothetical protein